MLNNREIATLIWASAIVLIFVAVPRLRQIMGPSVGDVLRSLAHRKVAGVFALFLLWCALWVWLSSLVRLWDVSLIKDTLFVVVGVGFPLLFRSLNEKTGADIARQVRREALSLSAFFAFYLNFSPLPLWGELILLPVVVLLTVVVGLGPHVERSGPLVGCFSVILGLIGVGLIVWATAQTVANWSDLDGWSIARQVALSIWLPVVMFPFLYGIAFYSATQTLLHRFSVLSKGMPLRAWLGVLVGLRFSVRWAKALNGRYNSIAESKTFCQALHEMRDFREDIERREALEQQRLDDLKGFAGEPGVDGTGAQLDRREFYGTKQALRWLHVTQVGRFEQRGNQFWDDITEVMLRPVSKYGLPDEHGIVVETTPDKGKWRAWRRMPNGSILGVGSAGRFGEYFYAGTEVPTSWPGEGGEWVDSTKAEWPPDWERNDGSRL